MLSTSQDIFWVAFAFAIFWIGLAAGFGLLYLALILRNVWRISESVKKKVIAVEKVVTAFRGRVENTASYVPPLLDAATKIIEAIAARKLASAEKGDKKKRRK